MLFPLIGNVSKHYYIDRMSHFTIFYSKQRKGSGQLTKILQVFRKSGISVSGDSIISFPDRNDIMTI